MVDTNELRRVIDASGMTVTAIAEKCGITRETLYNKLKTGLFYASEIAALTDILHLTRDKRDAIFFNN